MSVHSSPVHNSPTMGNLVQKDDSPSSSQTDNIEQIQLFLDNIKLGSNMDIDLSQNSRVMDLNYVSSEEENSSSESIYKADRNIERSFHTAGDLHAINYHSSIGLECLPDQRMHLVARKGSSFNLMVVGESGVGKTTFINTLFGTSILSNPEHRNLYGEKTKSITLHKSELIEDNFKLKFTVIDTPGFGDYTNNTSAWIPITKYIDEQFRLYLFQEEQPDRAQLSDSRVHCCLYFLPPTGNSLTPLDIVTMKELCKRVNLIPVIGKSDTFTKKDLERFKLIVKTTLSEEKIDVCNLLTDDEINLKIYSKIPFALIGSENSYTKPDGSSGRGRKYRWGLAEVENESHCDFIALRNILMSQNMLDFILSTETHYEKYRCDLLSSRFVEIYKKENQIADIKEDSTELEAIENLKKNGLDSLLITTKYDLRMVERKLGEKDPILLDRQILVKKRFSEIVSTQETRFKEWKKALVERQNTFNKDIESTHAYIVKLQDSIQYLEMESAEF